MQCKLRLLSALLCLGAIECQANTLADKIGFSLDMPFDNLTAFYVDPDWIKLQMKDVSFYRFGLLRSDQQDITIDGMQQFILLNQYHLQNGGAILGKNVVLSNNKGLSIFYGNKAQQKGGSIYATESIRITKNRFPCLFINNLPLEDKASNMAACIYADSIYIEDNPGLILFKNNHSKQNTNAGAIGFGSELIIRNSGPVVFENNQAYWGAAICSPLVSPPSPCTLRLFADRGDIIFNNNINVDRRRNAIHFQSNYDAQFGARKGYFVRFYDPVEASHKTTIPTIFNPLPEHLGTVLFSGITVPKNTKFTSLSLSSIFSNQVQIAHGIVAVEDEACLFIHKLLPGEGTVRLGNTSIFATTHASTNTTEAPNLNVQHLALNLPSLLQPNALPPKIWTSPKATNGRPPYSEDDRNTKIIISGDLTFLDDDNNPPYDSMDLSQPRHKIPLVYLCDTATPKIDVTNWNLDAINQTDHYGYQGTWEPFWETYTSVSDTTTPGTTNTNHRILYAHWKPTDYKPNPRFVSHFAANSLWVTTYGILPYLQATAAKSAVCQAQGRAVRTIHRQQNKNDIPGFNVSSKGYWTSVATSASLARHQLSFQFGQDFTQTKEKNSHNRIASKAYTSAMQFSSSCYYDSINVAAKAAYAYGTHRIHNIYADDNPAYSVGDFYTQTLGASFSTSLPIGFPQLSSLIDPFIEVKGVHASVSAFQEKGPYKKVLRSFLMKNPLIDVSSALGVALYPITPPKYIHWFTSIAYQPTIYRQRPKLQTVLLSSNGTWNVRGSAPEKHALLTQFNFAFSPISHFHLEAEYRGSFASSTTNHFITAGCSLYF